MASDWQTQCAADEGGDVEMAEMPTAENLWFPSLDTYSEYYKRFESKNEMKKVSLEPRKVYSAPPEPLKKKKRAAPAKKKEAANVAPKPKPTEQAKPPPPQHSESESEDCNDDEDDDGDGDDVKDSALLGEVRVVCEYVWRKEKNVSAEESDCNVPDSVVKEKYALAMRKSNRFKKQKKRFHSTDVKKKAARLDDAALRENVEEKLARAKLDKHFRAKVSDGEDDDDSEFDVEAFVKRRVEKKILAISVARAECNEEPEEAEKRVRSLFRGVGVDYDTLQKEVDAEIEKLQQEEADEEDGDGELTERQMSMLEVLFPEFVVDSELFTHTLDEDDVMDESVLRAVDADDEAAKHMESVDRVEQQIREREAERRAHAAEARENQDLDMINDYDEEDDFIATSPSAKKAKLAASAAASASDAKTAVVDPKKSLKKSGKGLAALKNRNAGGGEKKSSDEEAQLSSIDCATLERSSETGSKRKRSELEIEKENVEKEKKVEPADFVHRRLLSSAAIERVEQVIVVKNKCRGLARQRALCAVSEALLNVIAMDYPTLYENYVKSASKLKPNFSAAERNNVALDVFCKNNKNWLAVKPETPEKSHVRGLRLVDVVYTLLRMDECREALYDDSTLLSSKLTRGLAGERHSVTRVLSASDARLLWQNAPNQANCALSGKSLREGDVVQFEAFFGALTENQDVYNSCLKAAKADLADGIEAYAPELTSASDLTAPTLAMIAVTTSGGYLDAASATSSKDAVLHESASDTALNTTINNNFISKDSESSMANDGDVEMKVAEEENGGGGSDSEKLAEVQQIEQQVQQVMADNPFIDLEKVQEMENEEILQRSDALEHAKSVVIAKFNELKEKTVKLDEERKVLLQRVKESSDELKQDKEELAKLSDWIKKHKDDEDDEDMKPIILKKKAAASEAGKKISRAHLAEAKNLRAGEALKEHRERILAQRKPLDKLRSQLVLFLKPYDAVKKERGGKKKMHTAKRKVAVEEDAQPAAKKAKASDALDSALKKPSVFAPKKSATVAITTDEELSSVNWTRAAAVDANTRHQLAAEKSAHSLNVANELAILGEGFALLASNGEVVHCMQNAGEYFFNPTARLKRMEKDAAEARTLLVLLACREYDTAPQLDNEPLSELEIQIIDKRMAEMKKSKGSDRMSPEQAEEARSKLEQSFLQRSNREGDVDGTTHRTTASALLSNIDLIERSLDSEGWPMYDVRALRYWIMCIAMLFRHPIETVESKDLGGLEKKSLAAQKAEIFRGTKDSVSEKHTLRANHLPFGRHLTSNQNLLYLVRAVQQTLADQVADRVRSADEADDESEANGEGGAAAGFVNMTAENLLELLKKRLRKEAAMSEREYAAHYEWCALRSYNERREKLKARYAAEVAEFARIRTLNLQESMIKEVETGLKPATCMFFNQLFPFHY